MSKKEHKIEIYVDGKLLLASEEDIQYGDTCVVYSLDTGYKFMIQHLSKDQLRYETDDMTDEEIMSYETDKKGGCAA